MIGGVTPGRFAEKTGQQPTTEPTRESLTGPLSEFQTTSAVGKSARITPSATMDGAAAPRSLPTSRRRAERTSCSAFIAGSATPASWQTLLR
jgi:hypothetical protein